MRFKTEIRYFYIGFLFSKNISVTWRFFILISFVRIRMLENMKVTRYKYFSKTIRRHFLPQSSGNLHFRLGFFYSFQSLAFALLFSHERSTYIWNSYFLRAFRCRLSARKIGDFSLRPGPDFFRIPPLNTEFIFSGERSADLMRRVCTRFWRKLPP